MKFILALLLGVAFAEPEWIIEHTFDTIAGDFDALGTFHTWATVFEKHYEDEEHEAKRFLIWLDSLSTIASHNSQQSSYKLRLNQFSDLTGDEFRQYVHGEQGACFRPSQIANRNGQDLLGHMGENPMVPAPDSVDWSTKGVVTPVKNQGQCGSCWAFSATGAIECQYAIQKGTLNSLSEQQLVDCAGATYGCFGCNGGQMTGAMRYAAHDNGLCSESEYRYTARNGNCQASSCGTKYDANTGYNGVTPYSSSALETATAAGCVSIGIEADQTAFQHYSSGVLTGTCGTSIDHGVLTVGYGTSGSQQYWKVKNSWGVSWGSQGYILICRNCNKNGRDGECGILMEPNVPTF